MSELLRAEDLSDLLASDAEDSAELIPDEEFGYDRVIPRPDLADDIVKTYCDAIRKAEEDRKEAEKEIAKSEAIYEAKGDVADPVSTITIPIAKQVINQQLAFLSTQILTKTPLISVKPIDDGTYEIPSEIGQDGAMTMEQVSAVEAGRLYEAFLHYKLTERLDFGQLVDDTLYSIHVGENPTYWKIEYEPRSRTIKRKKYVKLGEHDNVVKILGYEDTSVPDGEAVKIKHVFGPNVLMPISATDLQLSPWVAEKTPMTTMELWKGIKDRKIDFALGADANPSVEDIAAVLGTVTDPDADSEIAMTLNQIDQKVAAEPERTHDVRTLWFYYPIRRSITAADEKGEATSTQVIEIRSLCGKIHYTARKLLALYVNPYPKRPYQPFFMRKRPHRYSGTSPAQDLGPFQRLISQIFHLQVQNAVQQNVKVFLVREGSVTWRYLKRPENKLRPGLMIPFGQQDDIKAEQLGAAVQSMVGEISYLTTTAQRLAVEVDYTEIPNRLPAATFAQNEAQAKMQPQTVLRAFRRSIGKAIEMYMQTVAQYSQYEAIPFLDPKTNQRVSKLIAFPRDVFEQHFSFEVTATGDDDTVQSRVERGSMLLKETAVENDQAMKLLAVIMSLDQPPETKEPVIRLLVRLETIYGELLEAVRPDAQKFVLSEAYIRDIMQKAIEAAQLRAEQQAEAERQAAAAQGGQNGVQLPPAGPGGQGGPLPADQGGPAGSPAEPGNAGIPQPPPS